MRREEAAEWGAGLGACSGADAAHFAQEEEAQQRGLRLRVVQRRISLPLLRPAVRRNKGVPVVLAPEHVRVLGVRFCLEGGGRVGRGEGAVRRRKRVRTQGEARATGWG